MTKVVKRCPMCGRHGYMMADEDRVDMIGLVLIQNLFPELNPVEREFLKTGYCPECQKLLFGNGETERVRYQD